MSDMTVAKTILEQLGGNKFLMMTGAKHLTGSANWLSFRIPMVTKNKANFVKVTLDASDTYTVEFLSVRGTKVTPKGSFSDIYNDQLQTLFTAQTGLYTSLGTMGRK